MLPVDLDANVAPFAFAAAGLPTDTFEVLRFRAREALSEPYAVDLELASRDPNVDFAALLGQPATLVRFRGLDPVPIHGVVTAVDLGARSVDRTVYRVRLEPALSRLALAVQSRVFQDVTVVDVARALLAEHGLTGSAVRLDAAGPYPQHEYVVQYEETDLAFFRRLLEREGIWFQFEHPEDGARETLVVTDRRSAFEPVGPGPSGAAALVYREGSGMVRDRPEAVWALRLREHVVPGRVVLKDYNYRTPDTELLAQAPVEGGGDQEVYLYGEHFKDLAEGQRLAQTRAEEIACRRRVAKGDSDAAGLTPGATFRLEGHYRDDLNAEWLVTAVEHEGVVAPDDAYDAGGDGAPPAPRYANKFEAIPAKAPFRPERSTPVPKAPGLMTGRVESGGGEYAYLDEDGRYRARLSLDRSDQPQARATKPVRMAQPYSGADYGLHFPNHAGTEIILGFANGDVDRPMALGTVPNPSQSSPSTSPNRMENVIRSWSGHELVLDDRRGAELVHLTSVKDHTETVADAQNVNVGSSQSITVGTDRSKRVEANQSESVGENKSIDVGGTHTETIGDGATIDVGAGRATRVGEDERLDVGRAQVTTVATDVTTTIGERLMVQVGASSDHAVADGARVDVGADARLDVGTELVVDVADRITIRCGGASITLSSNGDIQLAGANISVKGSGTVALKGSTITEN